MKKLKSLLFTLAALIMSTAVYAQDEKPVGEFMHSRERSYVVIAVMLTILVGLILYVIKIDRKISKLEKRNEI